MRIATLTDGHIKAIPTSFARLRDALRNFCAFADATITQPPQLASIMALKAVLLRDAIVYALRDIPDTPLRHQLTAVREVLMRDMLEAAFANMYAQTITYGLFVARLHGEAHTFSRQSARDLVSQSNPFLRRLFDALMGADMDESIAWIANDLVEVFRRVDTTTLLAAFDQTSEDPFLHFYETFLAAYDRETRVKRGVYYTPLPVVRFIVSAVNDIIKQYFDLSQGLADTSTVLQHGKPVHKVQILDPATGTGTFLAEVVSHIHTQFLGQDGAWPGYVDAHLIPRLHGFEYLMTPYVMCHLKLDMLLRRTGYAPAQTGGAGGHRRMSVYLTNALETDTRQHRMPFMQWLADEANAANAIKNTAPIMVVMGNPPYAGESANPHAFVTELAPYKLEPATGGRLQERNPKWLNDDYVKFIRLAQQFIDKNAEGVLAYITNHSFLDNITFRGMRYSLLQSFDSIYVLDLHGNAKKKERTPDGGKDENIFAIQQGVSILLCVKTSTKAKDTLANVKHAHIYGTRAEKFAFCENHTLTTVPFVALAPCAPHYFFVPKNTDAQATYEAGFAVNALFPVNSVGMVTARDKLCVQHNKDDMRRVLRDVMTLDTETLRERYTLGKDTRDWKVTLAQKDVQVNQGDEARIVPFTYRPFDTRYTYYTGHTRGFHCMPRNTVMQHLQDIHSADTVGGSGGFHCRPRHKVMQHLLAQDNIALAVGRQGHVVGDMPWNLVFLTKHIADINLFYRGGEQVCPLYIYNGNGDSNGSNGKNGKNGHNGDTLVSVKTRRPNCNEAIVKSLAAHIACAFVPEKTDAPDTFAPIDIFDYIYAVLHSPYYRATFKEFLKTDFPRIPYPQDKMQFWALVALGTRLRGLHLLHNIPHQDFITTYPIAGDNIVDRIIYDDGKVRINATQYFDNVPKNVWDFYTGGYQPAQKWLKERKGRLLTFDDIMHYQKMVLALHETIGIMPQIDALLL